MKTFGKILLWLLGAIIAYFLMSIYAVCSLAWAWLPLIFKFYGGSYWLGLVASIFVSFISHIIYNGITDN